MLSLSLPDQIFAPNSAFLHLNSSIPSQFFLLCSSSFPHLLPVKHRRHSQHRPPPGGDTISTTNHMDKSRQTAETAHKNDTQEPVSSDNEMMPQPTATKRRHKRKPKKDNDSSSSSATSWSGEEDERKSSFAEQPDTARGDRSHPDDRPRSVNEFQARDEKPKADSSDSSSSGTSSLDTEADSRASTPTAKQTRPSEFSTEPVTDKSPRHSDLSSTSSCESVKSDSTDRASKQANALWSTPDNTETDANRTVTDEDCAGGHDPDEMASDQTPRAVLLSRIGVTPGERYNGSIRPLVTDRSNIEIMSIDLNKDQVAELCELIQDHGEVESLVLRNTGLDDNDIEKLAVVMATTPDDDLQMLNLNCNAISASGAHHIVSILRNKSHLELLLLHNSPLGDLGIHTLVQGLLEVDGVKAADDSHIQRAARGIVSNVIQHAIESSVKEGDIESRSSSNVSSGSAETERVVSRYEHAQRRGRLRLEHLDIGDCQISDRGMDAVGALVRANTAINTLCLTGNKGVTAKGWRVLGEALRDNTQIETLTLDYTTLGDEGIMAFMDNFNGNKTLKSLDLEGNRIGDLGGKRLLDLVQACPNLDDITLMPGNHISVALLNSIKQVLAARDK